MSNKHTHFNLEVFMIINNIYLNYSLLKIYKCVLYLFKIRKLISLILHCDSFFFMTSYGKKNEAKYVIFPITSEIDLPG